MKVCVYSVFDSKIATFARPFYAMNDASAVRAFSDNVADTQDPQNAIARHPEDFSLFRLGEFDDNSGEFIPEKPQSLMTASNLAVKKTPQKV